MRRIVMWRLGMAQHTPAVGYSITFNAADLAVVDQRTNSNIGVFAAYIGTAVIYGIQQ